MNIVKSGFVAIVGLPNVGKSTLMNAVIGEKLSIISPKPQTTRTRVMGILNLDGCQMIFLDTPGFHAPKTKLGEYMVKEVSGSISDVDVAVLVVDPLKRSEDSLQAMAQKINLRKMPAILAINKIDILGGQRVAEAILDYKDLCDFKAIVPISARLGTGVNELIDEIKKEMPDGPELFPQDMLTDQLERQIAAEIIREKLLIYLDEEVPHGTAVEIESMGEKKDTLFISATIFCEKDSHKGIIIGKHGAMLKKIGSGARKDLTDFFDSKVFLELFVKVRENWRNKGRDLKDLGFK